MPSDDICPSPSPSSFVGACRSSIIRMEEDASYRMPRCAQFMRRDPSLLPPVKAHRDSGLLFPCSLICVPVPSSLLVQILGMEATLLVLTQVHLLGFVVHKPVPVVRICGAGHRGEAQGHTGRKEHGGSRTEVAIQPAQHGGNGRKSTQRYREGEVSD